MAPNKKTKRHRYIGITLVVLNCMTFLIAIAVMALGTPPPGTVTITSPGPSTLIESPNFTVTGTATPNKQIQVYLNNAYVGQTTSNNNGDWHVDVTGVKNGQINLYAKISEEPFLYITHKVGPKTFTQVDTSTNSIVSTISAGLSEPTVSAAHPTLPKAYINSPHNYNVKEINTDTMESVYDYDAGGEVNGSALSSDGSKLFTMTSSLGGPIKIFDTSSHAVLTSSTATGLTKPKFSPDGTKLYIFDGNDIQIRSTADLTVTDTISFGSSCSDFGINPNGQKLYAVCGQDINIVDLNTNTITNTVNSAVAVGGIKIAPNGGYALLISVGTGTQKFDLATDSIVGDIPNIASPVDVEFSPDSSKIFADMTGDDMYVVDGNDFSILGSKSSISIASMKVTHDGAKLIMAQQSSAVIAVYDAANDPFNLLTTKDYPQFEYFSVLTADGTKVFAGSAASKKIYRINTTTNTVEKSFDAPYGCSPDILTLNKTETKIYYKSSTCGGVIIILDADTGDFINYILTSGYGYSLTMNSTGTKLYSGTTTGFDIIDIATDTVADQISTGGSLALSTISSDDSTLYLADNNNGKVIVFDTVSNTVTDTVNSPIGIAMMALNPAGTILYVDNFFSNNYAKMSTASNTFIGSPVSTSSLPTSISFLPDGSKMYIVTGNSKVDIFDPSTDLNIGQVDIADGAYMFTSGTIRNRVINTATQDVFINAPELGQLQTVPPGYTPAGSSQSVTPSDSSAGRLNLAPVGGDGIAGTESASGVASSQGNNSNSSNFFGNLPNNLVEAIKATPASVARVFPWVLFTLLLGLAGILMLQVFLEYRNIKQTIALANKERSLRSEKKNFLELSAHYLRTPLSIIQSGLQLINYKNKKHEADGALNISKLLGGEIENVLQKLQDEQAAEPKLKSVEYQSIGWHVLASPAFLIPAIFIGIVSIVANILFINVAKLDLGVINLITQAMFFITAVTVFYFVVRTFSTSRARQRAAKDLLEEEKQLSNARNQLITDTHKILSEQLQRLSASIGTIKIKDQKPLLDVAAGIKSFEETLSKFELAAALQAGSTALHRNEQVNMAKLVSDTAKDHKGEQKDKDLTVTTKLPSFGNVTTDAKSLRYIVSTLIDNAYKFSPKKSTVAISGNRTSLGYKLTIADQGPGINKGQLQQLFKPFSRVDNAMVFEKQGMGLSLYLDRLIMQSLGGKISVDSAAGKGTRVTLLLP